MIKRAIYKAVYGADWVRDAFFLDLRKPVMIVLCKDRSSFVWRGLRYIWSDTKAQNNTCLYLSDCSAPLEYEFDPMRCSAWIDSREFTTVFENKLLEALMMSRMQSYIMIILVLAGLAVLISAYGALQAHSALKNTEDILRLLLDAAEKQQGQGTKI